MTLFSRTKLPSSTSSKQNPVPVDEALSFEADIALRSYKSERRAWLLVAVFAAIAALAVAAVAGLTPLKTTVPYYIFVDKETGVMQTVVVSDPSEITHNEAVARYWLSRYVSARERYVYRLQQEDYDFVMATSMTSVAQEYAEPYKGENNRAELLKESIEERVRILSVQVTPGTRGRGTVRYQKIVWRAGMREPESVKTYVADVAFEWVSTSGWNSKNLLLNPMGFAVPAYRTTQELQAQ